MCSAWKLEGGSLELVTMFYRECYSSFDVTNSFGGEFASYFEPIWNLSLITLILSPWCLPVGEEQMGMCLPAPLICDDLWKQERFCLT